MYIFIANLFKWKVFLIFWPAYTIENFEVFAHQDTMWHSERLSGLADKGLHLLEVELRINPGLLPTFLNYTLVGISIKFLMCNSLHFTSGKSSWCFILRREKVSVYGGNSAKYWITAKLFSIVNLFHTGSFNCSEFHSAYSYSSEKSQDLRCLHTATCLFSF